MADRRAMIKALLEGEAPDYGYGPMTADTRAGVPNPEMRNQAPRLLDALPGYAQAQDDLRRRVEMPAGENLRDFAENGPVIGPITQAIEDPSLANLTNAGMQTAFVAGAPKIALGALGTGLGIAGAKDTGLLDAVGQAVAPASANADQFDDQISRINSMTAEIRTRHAKEQADAARLWDRQGLGPKAKIEAKKALDAKQAGELSPFNEQVLELGREQAKKFGSEEQARIAKEKTMTRTAEAERDKALARDKRFSDTEVGKISAKLGGYDTGAAGAIGGGIYRLATGPASSAFKAWAGPAIVGATAGELSAHAQPWYNATRTEADNPLLVAAEAYAREAPNGPERDRALAQAQHLRETGQTTNPVHDAGQAEFYDPWKFGERTFAGLWQGAGGGKFGSLLASIPTAAGRAAGSVAEEAGAIPGRVAKGWNRGMGEAAEAKAAADAANAKKILARRLLEKAQGQTSHQTGSAPAPAEAAPAPAATSPPPAASSPVAPASTSPVPANQLPNGAPAAGGGQATIGLDPDLRQAIIDALSKTGATKQKALPAPGTGPGRWISEVQPTARDVLREHLAGGGTIAKGSGNKLTDEINARLPVSAKEISPAEVRKRVSNMRDAYGDRPDMARLEADVPMGSDVLKGKRVFGIAAPLAAIGASGEDPRELARNILMGR